MPIQIGDQLPAATLFQMGADSVTRIESSVLWRDKRVILFALPGAFTPTCSALHLPGYLARHADFLQRGIDTIACLSVNDPFVMAAWAEQQGVNNRVMMLADGNAEFTRAFDLAVDRSDAGMGLRSQRYAMLVSNGFVEVLNVEAPGKFEVSDAETMLAAC